MSSQVQDLIQLFPLAWVGFVSVLDGSSGV